MSAVDCAPPRRRWFLDVAPLRESPAYRRFWMSGVAGGIGTQLTAVAIGIQVYDLSGTTAAVALVGGFALAPMIVMGIFGGAIVDAFDRRKVLIVASSISFVAPLGIAGLSWLSVTELWPYYVFTTLSSTVGALVGAARFAIHPRLVERRLLPAVAALSGISAGLQSAVGPALGGLLVAAVGFAWTYTIDLGLFLVGFWGIASLPAIVPAVRARVGPAAIAEGLRFLRSARNLRTAIGIQIATFAFGRAYALLPAVGAVLLGGGATTVGILVAASAVGVIVSGVLSGPLGRVRRQGRAMLIAAGCMASGVAVFGALVLTLSLLPHDADAHHVDLPWLIGLATALVLVGAADNIAGIFRTTMMQSAAPDEMRGRLQGLYTLVLTAGPRVGDVFAGFVAAAGALWWPPLLGAVVIGIVLVAIARLRPAFRQYDAREPVP
ncbi:MFS transporter [Pseudolysinimonas kribbensis]|uniref:MFS transporter n=1 Tax=Pseudolysinimonas kribbensis TaxID=433641 RepID=A0ABQ6K304_9MICO|nr:MFS transporter [Pseudolysinimonas kribbensis]GMA95007.1 MFS transporter [Pseudolysinimonas kribbensis]